MIARRSIALLACIVFTLAALVVPAQTPPAAGDGVTVERVRASEASTVRAGDGRITIVRVDLARQRLRLMTASHYDGARTLPEWLSEFHLTGGTNASMFGTNGRSVGFMVREGVTENRRINPLFGGFLAFDALPRVREPAAVFGTGCGAEEAAMRRSYASIVQTYRLLACDGSPIAWVDSKIYSAAAVGMDRDGHAVFVHSRTPFTMRVFARMLAAPALRIRHLLFVEGGPESSLVVGGSHAVSEVGSWETDFHEADDNRVFWPVPNIIAFEARR